MTKRILISFAAVMALAVCARAGWPPEIRRALADAKELYVASERKDGTRSSAAPVWFGVLDGELWINTKPASYKARRAQQGRPMHVAASAAGPFVQAKAEVFKDAAVAERLGEVYREKYWMAWVGLFRPSAEKVEAGEIVLIKLTPEE